MADSVKNEDDFESAKSLFQDLGLENWKIDASLTREGGQSVVLGVKHRDGRKGVFRHLKQKDDASIARFKRELGILTNERLKHRNIVSILASTANDEHYWYISERGQDFGTYWKQQREKLSENPDELVLQAMVILTQICDGLKTLHENGVVHRDIKPANIVCIEEGGEKRPVLIDFGISHLEEIDAERLTQIDDATGNARYSPDVMMNRLDDVPPWLDVFQLAQVLIWMTNVSPTKKWTRPLDWRWVNYDPRLSDGKVLVLRAVTALCSERSTSPQTAKELFSLLNELFPSVSSTKLEAVGSEIDLASIETGIASGKAIDSLTVVNDHKAIESSFVQAKTFVDSLKPLVESLEEMLNDAGVEFRRTTFNDLETHRDSLLSGSVSNESELVHFEFGSGNPFHVRISSVVYLPSLEAHMSRFKPESSNLFTFYFQCYANSTRIPFPSVTQVVTLERNGTLQLRNEAFDSSGKTTVAQIVETMKNWIEDPEPWRVINVRR